MWNPLLSFSADPQGRWLWVDVSRQQLGIMTGREAAMIFPISTAANGLGETRGSGCTPRGWHVVRARIGEGLPGNAILRGRRWTGECYTPALAAEQPARDWILGRILWLSGLEPGRNRGGRVDTFRRYIYIHGTADETHLGKPVSAGCVRLSSNDMLTLFPQVAVGVPVFIGDEPPQSFLSPGGS
ncbi:L,D-transpeptidase family protein [Acidithiobacillus sp.]